MATTSSTLTASTAAIGKGNKGRMVGLITSTALGLALLTGVAFGQGREGAQPAAAPMSGVPASAPAAPNRGWAISDGTRPGFLEPGPGEGHGRLVILAASDPGCTLASAPGLCGDFSAGSLPGGQGRIGPNGEHLDQRP